MLSAPKCFWYNKSIFALRNKNCFDRKPKMTKKTVNPWLPAPPGKMVKSSPASQEKFSTETP